MGAVTYPDASVQAYISQHFVPVQLNVVERPEVMDQFNTPWTPTLITQDGDGREHRRTQGYHDPRRLIAELSLARLLANINRRRFVEAADQAAETLRHTEGDAYREPETLYWMAVAAYKASDDARNLTDGWNNLLDRFPESEWARRVEFIRR